MTFQPATDTLLVEFLWSGPGDLRWQNNLHFTKDEFDADDIDELLAFFAITYAASDFIADVSSDVTLGEIVGTDLRSEGAVQRTLIVGEVGDNVGDMAAQGAALVATLRTGLRGRSYRGRFYFSGCSDTLLVDGAWTIATAGHLQELLEDLQAIAETIGFTLVVLSRWHDHIERVSALGEAVTDILIRALAPGSQRRRNRRP